ncbi:MAG: cation-translocating P-type ATPase [Ruminococcus sp.]|nr:cation-translocating P-type ATPase [Ruminococcus sp.]
MFEEKSIGEVTEHFHTDPEQGLSWAEAVTRLSADGRNELEGEPKKSVPETFLEQLNDPLICVLLVAAFVSFLLKEFSDTIIIGVVIVLNAAVGVIQEGKAQKALDSLKKLTSPEAHVRRGGEIRRIAAAELAPGDVVLLEAGMQVPADLRLIKTWNLKIEESALTGESLPVEKDADFQSDGELQIGERKNEAFMSTMVAGGRGEGIVIARGMQTEIGKIASIIKTVPKEFTPLQRKLAELGKFLSIVSVLLCVLLFGIAVLQKRDILEMLITAISLAVAAVPEGLPAVVTIVLAMSVSRMVKVNTIVRKLPSVETLGAVNVVCSDKTGTLTQNKMTVTRCYTNEQSISISTSNIREQAEIPELFLQGFALCNDAVLPESGSIRRHSTISNGICSDSAVPEGGKAVGDPTEIALLSMASKCGVRKTQAETQYPRVAERAFDSARKMMTTVHQNLRKQGHYIKGGASTGQGQNRGAQGISEAEQRGGQNRSVYAQGNSNGGLKGGQSQIAFTKGAPDVVLKRCTKIYLNGKVQPLNDMKRRKIQAALEEMSSQALRVLALAMKEGEGDPEALLKERDLVFLGLAGMKDPIRPEAREAVAKFGKASVRTIMITGDHADTAFAIAKELGIAKKPDQCMTGAQMDNLSDHNLRVRLKETNVFARVSPEHKVRIVKLLKECGNIVAMTGDGVNDAPSLRTADIGISMGLSGTDVAKNASDMILTDDNFATIEKAIEEGRSIFQNIKKTVLFLLSSNFGEIITMFTAVLLGLAAPLKASHILWINLITDSLPALALGVDENDKEALMREPPRSAKEGMFANGGLACTIFYGLLIAAISLTAFLKIPWEVLAEGQKEFCLSNIAGVLQDEAVLARAQTYAFTVLGMSQLFHALGMRDVRTSVFSGKRTFNPVMAAAFVLGILLQMAVTEIPYLVNMFGTAPLVWQEWAVLLILAAFPVLAHEIFVLTGNGEE